VPASTTIEGNANPNNPIDKTIEPDSAIQTYFVATAGVTDYNAPYCGTNNNLQPGEAQKLRIGFLLNSYTTVKNINFQGKDTVRPADNGNLCGGGAFETPGCVSPGFGDGPGTDGRAKRNGCYDHTGKGNDLITGDGKGVENVTIDSVRLNNFLPLPADLKQGKGSQLAVFVAMTQDGSATKNVKVTNLVSMLTRADGINYHGNVQNSIVEESHIENTGDDIYAFWGAYAENPTSNVFKNSVGKNAGVTRGYMYGVCVAVYGAIDLTITGNTCYDLNDWNPGQVPSGDNSCQNGAYCNSCFAYVHDNWFGAVYPNGNAIQITNNQYLYMDGTPIPDTDRPKFRTDKGSNAHVISAPPSPPPPGWTKLGDYNCYAPDNGASKDLNDGPDHAGTHVDGPSACVALCSSAQYKNQGCNAAILRLNDNACFLRSGLEKSKCDTRTKHGTYDWGKGFEMWGRSTSAPPQIVI
jgi:hypothetical protein